MPGDGCRTPMRAPSPPPTGERVRARGAEGQTARHPSLARRRCCIFQPGSIYIITLQFVARCAPALPACLPREVRRGGAERGGAGRGGEGRTGWGGEGKGGDGRGGVRRGGVGRGGAE